MDLKKIKKAAKAVVKFLRPPGALEASLAMAVRDNNLERAKKLIGEGASPGKITYRSENALSLAVENGNLDMVKLLVSAGADPNARTRYYFTTPFLESARKGQAEIVPVLLDAGADIQAQDDYGDTAYALAVAARNKPLAGLLLERGANIDARNRRGWTPLFFAARNGDLETASILIDKGARLDYRDGDGNTALDIARAHDRQAVFRKLQEAADAKIPEWQVTKAGELAHVSTLRGAGYRLTEVFNFETKQCTVISHNFATQQDAVAVKTFADLGSETVKAAEARLAQLKPQPAVQP